MSSSSVLVELQYLPCLEYIALFIKYDHVWIEANEFFEKQSYRNRCYILTANAVATLSVPVIKSNRKQLAKDVKIDYQQKWLTDHWRTITSAYGKAPFFEYYAGYFEKIFLKRYNYLFDLNLDLLTNCLFLLRIEKKILFSPAYKKSAEIGQDDLRSRIHPKKSYKENNIYQPKPYIQNFGSNFVSNLSIIDVLFCKGNDANEIIRQSLIV